MTSHRSYTELSDFSNMHRLRDRRRAPPAPSCNCTYLLLAAFVASALYRLPSLIITVVILSLVDTARRTIHSRNGDIALATGHALGSCHRGRCMVDTRHYGTRGCRIIINCRNGVRGLGLRPSDSTRSPKRRQADDVGASGIQTPRGCGKNCGSKNLRPARENYSSNDSNAQLTFLHSSKLIFTFSADFSCTGEMTQRGDCHVSKL